jgi:hypothetical protein
MKLVSFPWILVVTASAVACNSQDGVADTGHLDASDGNTEDVATTPTGDADAKDGRFEADAVESDAVDSDAVDSAIVAQASAFTFFKPAPSDPPGKKDFGLDQMTKVADALTTVPSPDFHVEVAVDPNQISVASLRATFAAYRDSLGDQDTFVLYSHTHGETPGLLIDFETGSLEGAAYRWEDLAEDIVALPARNVVIFVMACHSGYLAEALNALGTDWKGQRETAGRSLVVLTAVSKDQLSNPTDVSTAPTAIGNPFTYAVRTALGGAADGASDGEQDKKVTLSELVEYVLETAKEASMDGYADPQFAGEFVAEEVLFSVP